MPAGQRFERLISTMDLYPTMLSYAGVDVPGRAVGRDLRPVIEGRAPLPPHVSIGAVYRRLATHGGRYPERDVLALYRRGDRWKFVWYVQDFTVASQGGKAHFADEMVTATAYPRHEAGDVDLYDLERDPYELHDLASSPAHAARIEQYREDVLHWWKDTGGRPIPYVDDP